MLMFRVELCKVPSLKLEVLRLQPHALRLEGGSEVTGLRPFCKGDHDTTRYHKPQKAIKHQS